MVQTAMVQTATAVWQGDLKGGSGTLSVKSGVLSNIPYTFDTRFAGKEGTNPEELIGAAHAGCFTMALSGEIGKAGLKAERLETTAEVTLETVDGKPTVTKSHLRLTAKVPGMDKGKFDAMANAVKDGCIVSRLLKADLSLEATLEG